MNDAQQDANRFSTKAIEENFNKLKEKLRELFQLDRGDLDFGLYRVMALKRDEVDRFLGEDLLPQITKALGDIAKSDAGVIEERLKKSIATARELDFDPDDSSEIRKMKAQLKAAENDQQREADTYNHLCNFFARYYDQGDFMSLRRYKSGGREAYSIPYNGEEVKLHWANSDQYYIKTTENYASYVFIVNKGGKDCRVRFEIADADNEKDNIKETNGNNRLFVLSKDFLTETDNELIVRFEHRPLTAGEKKKHPQNGNRRQESINKETEKCICDKLKKLKSGWHTSLAVPVSGAEDESHTVLRKHVTAYTAKNSFDYFIHKDLGGFLRRELDYYLKSEVVSIANLELTDDPEVFFRTLAQVKAIKLVGNKIIDFLAQLEDFQKQLWLKKKFVLETQYCVTLDKIPEALYAEIAKNKSQCDEWVKLFAIDELKGDLVATPYSKRLKSEFLKENPYLVLDTRHFDKAFTDKLLAALSETAPIEEQMNGVLVHGENFQALNLLQERYREQVQCVYIDPPYNTDASAIMYKNGYKDSSWLSLIYDRMLLARYLLTLDGILCCAIDDEEISHLRLLMQGLFENEVGTALVRSNPVGRKSTGHFSPCHEYAMFFGMENALPDSLPKTKKELERYPFSDDKGYYAWLTLIRQGSNDDRENRPKLFYPIYVGKDDTLRIPKMKWNESKGEYDILEKTQKGEIAILPIRDSIEKCWHRGWERVQSEPDEYRVRRGNGNGNGNGKDGVNIQFKTRIDEEAAPRTWWESSEYASANHGARILKELFLENPFDFSKAVKLVEHCVVAAGGKELNANIIDYFAGSGTTGHAVINLNREDDGNRKYILVEAGHHFETVLLPRIKKVSHSKDWKDGKPVSREGSTQLFKYVRLESYEDTLDSLTIKSRGDLLSEAENAQIIEDYRLRYALPDEAAESPALLGQDFIDPFNYTLSVVRDGVRRDVTVDLAETFNYLLGLRLAGRCRIENILAVTGTNAQGQNCLILWRNLEKMSAAKLNNWFKKHRKTFGNDLDQIYVNGDHTLNALKGSKDKWEVITTEPVFKKLMFEE